MPNRSFNATNPQALNKFTGHEHDVQNSINLTYARARYLDPEIGQLVRVDPLAAKFPEWSPYNYTMGNPMNLVDPDERAATNCCPTNPNLFYALKQLGAKV
jgi:RHS repeat-associated protein